MREPLKRQPIPHFANVFVVRQEVCDAAVAPTLENKTHKTLKKNGGIKNSDALKYTSHCQVQKEMTGACVRERERDFCVAIVTFTNLSSGFRPSMPHSHSAALPAILSIPPLLQVSPCIWTPPSHCLFFFFSLFDAFLFIYFFFPQTVG